MNAFRKPIFAAGAALFLLTASLAHAQGASAPPAHVHGDAHDQTSNQPSSQALSDGEVRKVDKEGGRLTLAHGPIDNLAMPGMTMVFRVADPAMLDAVASGDKVRFHAEQINGRLTVTRIEAAR